MNTNLKNLYENILNEYNFKNSEDDHSDKQLECTNFSKFDLHDYTEIIYEGKTGHGDNKIVINLLKDGIRKNLITVKDTNSGWMVRSVNDPTKQELIHRGENSYHYLRRFMQKIS